VTTIYVTHDQEEAMTIADRMAIFREGRIIQIGTPEQVFNEPDTMDVAAFIGSPPMNLIDAVSTGGTLSVGGQRINITPPQAAPGEIVLGVRPSHIHLSDSGLPARLLLSENLGESMLLNLDMDGQIVKLRLPEVRRFTDGETLHLAFDPNFVHFFDPQSRKRIASLSAN
jgi:ABC-type sugar transport system ATPase subunit